MKRSLLFLMLLTATGAVSAAAQGEAVVGPPTLPPGDSAVGPIGGVQQFPAIAAGDGVHLAAWEDHRSAFSSLLVAEGARDVYAQLLDESGQPLSPLPFRVAGGLGRKEDVKVAWNGTHFLVTWQNVVPTATFRAAALFGARVDTDGQVLDDPPIVIKSYPWSSSFEYGLGSDGNTWAVVIQGSQNGEGDIEGWIVHPAGIPQMVSASVFTRPYVVFDFGLSWDGSQYLLSFADSGLRGYRVTSTLDLLGPEFAVAPSTGVSSSVTSPGSGWLVAFMEDTGPISSDIKYRSISPTGIPGATTTVTSGSEKNDLPGVAWTGSGYVLVWRQGLFDPSTLHFARLDASGGLLDPGGLSLASAGAPTHPVVSSTGNGNGQVAWMTETSTPPNSGDVAGARITPAGADAQVDIGTGVPRQGFADLARGPGGQYMAVFTSERAGSISILAQQVDASGVAIDAEPTELGVADTYGHPGVAWNGESYLVVWHDLVELTFETDNVVLGRRVGPDGTPVDPTPFQVLEGKDPAVGAAGDTFLVAARFAETTEIFHIHGARVASTGVVLDAVPLEIGGNFSRFPSVGSFGDRWLVAWQSNPSHDNPAASAKARVVLPDGTMTGQLFLGGGGGPSAAASPTTGLVTWSDGNVQAQRISPTGATLGGAFAVTSAPENQGASSVGWTGDEFLVAWKDFRNIEAFFDDRGDIYASRVGEDGAVLDPSGLAIDVKKDEDQMPVVAGGEGRALVAYAGYHADAPYVSVRTTFVTVTDGECGGENYCSTAPNSFGSGALMGFMGTTSVSADDLVLTCSGAVPGQPGLFYFGSDTVQIPFGDGFRCAGGQVTRFPAQLVQPGGTAARSADLGNHGQIAPGSTWHFQFWYRDPAAGGAGFNLSDGLSVSFCD